MRKKNGFTLIELLVVIAIMVILAAILIPGVTTAMKQAKSNRAVSEMQHLTTVITQVYSEVGYYVRLEDLAESNQTNVRRWISSDYTNGLSDGDVPALNTLSYTVDASDVSAMWAGPYTTYKSYCATIAANSTTPGGLRPLDPWGTMGNSGTNNGQYRMFWITKIAFPNLVPAGANGAMVIISAGADGILQSCATNKTTPALTKSTAPFPDASINFTYFEPTNTNITEKDPYYIFNAGIQ
ncbi:MAG: prepilin-type N-terminal cleavage/methylation domain-containing protein [Candidatus Ratteibacteria bacterium]|jgi:prepilin-type N-terminal cleavage/methylation domain-containing protein